MARNTKKKNHPKTEKFIYETDNGTITVPFIENLEMGTIEDMREAQDEGKDPTPVIFASVMDEESRAVRRKMTVSEFIDFMEKWGEESSITLGEL